MAGQGPVAVYFEHNNESGCIEAGEYFDQSRNY